MHLIIDTETTGANTKVAKVLSFGAILVDDDLKTVGPQTEFMFNPGPDTVIPKEVSKIHGIFLEHVIDKPLIESQTSFFEEIVGVVDTIIGHNATFDYRILKREFPVWEEHEDKLWCSMRATTEFCRLPYASSRRKGFKWPKLDELAKILEVKNLREVAGDQHGALTDCKVLLSCLRKLNKVAPDLLTFLPQK